MNRKYIPLLILLITELFIWKMIVYGYIPMANDLVAHKPIAKWTETVNESSDEFPQWFPHLFSGMPSSGGYIYTLGDPTKTILNILFINRGIKIWFYLILGGLGLFYFLRQLNISIMASVFSGIVSCLTPYAFVLINAGHMEQIREYTANEMVQFLSNSGFVNINIHRFSNKTRKNVGIINSIKNSLTDFICLIFPKLHTHLFIVSDQP